MFGDAQADDGLVERIARCGERETLALRERAEAAEAQVAQLSAVLGLRNSVAGRWMSVYSLRSIQCAR